VLQNANRKKTEARECFLKGVIVNSERLGAAQMLHDLTTLPSNHVERLNGEATGRYAIGVNEQRRIDFEWPDRSPRRTTVQLVELDSGGDMTLVAIHPGQHLADELSALNMSASEFARRIKVPTNRVTLILNGQRAITGDTALRLAHFFGTSAEFWLHLQSLHELRIAEAKAGELIKQLPSLNRALRVARCHAIQKKLRGSQRSLGFGAKTP
jgi:antitoxin HigA-1